jgi:hypothetical protein
MKTGKSGNNELLETRFGLISIRKGFVTQDHLIKALEIQVLEEVEFGIHRAIGEIFLSQDVMSAGRLEEVLKDISQGVHI